MNRSTREVTSVLLAVIALVAGLLSGESEVCAKEKGPGLATLIQGGWVLVSIYNEQAGKKTDVFGVNPRGSLIFTPDGRFSCIIMRASLPKFATNARQKGTSEENQAIVQGSIAYFGTYKVVDEKEQMVHLYMEGSTFPNWDGQEHKRIMTVEKDELKIINPTPSIGGGTNYVIWKRSR